MSSALEGTTGFYRPTFEEAVAYGAGPFHAVVVHVCARNTCLPNLVTVKFLDVFGFERVIRSVMMVTGGASDSEVVPGTFFALHGKPKPYAPVDKSGRTQDSRRMDKKYSGGLDDLPADILLAISRIDVFAKRVVGCGPEMDANVARAKVFDLVDGFFRQQLGMPARAVEGVPKKKPSRPPVTDASIEAAIVGESTDRILPGDVVRCVLRMENGAIVTGESLGYADRNGSGVFDMRLASREARAKAIERAWELETYLYRHHTAAEFDQHF